MTKASQGELKGILGINEILSIQSFNHNHHSSIFDVTRTQVIKNKFSRVLSGTVTNAVSNRMCDTSIQISKLV